MRIIKIAGMAIRNFKKIEHIEPVFSNNTVITGCNGLGKTSIYDAYCWLIKGKDSSDQKKFGIRREVDGVLSTGECSVSAKLIIDNNTTIVLQRSIKDEVSTVRGSEVETVASKTVCTVDGVGVTVSKFDETVLQIFGGAPFDNISTVTGFPSLKWEDKRALLYKLTDCENKTGDISKSEEFSALTLGMYTAEEYLKVCKSNTASAKKVCNDIPVKAEEAKRRYDPDMSEPDMSNKDTVTRCINEINERISVVTGSVDIEQAIQDEQERVYSKEKAYTSCCNEIRNRNTAESNTQRNELISERAAALEEYTGISKKVSSLTGTISSLSAKSAGLVALVSEKRGKWDSVVDEFNAKLKSLSTGDAQCKCCGQDVPEQFRANIAATIKGEKKARLDSMANDGKKAANENSAVLDEIKKLSAELAKENNSLEAITKRGKELRASLEVIERETEEKINTEITALGYQKDETALKTLQEQKANNGKFTNPEVERLKKQLHIQTTKLEDLNRLVVIWEENLKQLDRVKELEAEQRNASEGFSKWSQQLDLCEALIKRRCEAVEGEVNKLFSSVKFRLFETQKNGGVKAACEILYDGIPYSTNLNTGFKVLAGADIALTLQKFYNVSAPLFVDSCESVSDINSKISSDSQLVFIRHDESEKKLKVINE